MRSREKLIEVLGSVNPCAVFIRDAIFAELCALALKDGPEPGTITTIAHRLAETGSPHIRDLATEALHYLEKDATHV